MRRCTNCGWNNKDEFSKCEKCNSQLTASSSSGPLTEPISPPADPTPVPQSANNAGAAPTHMGKRAAAPAWDSNVTPPPPPPPQTSGNVPKDADMSRRKHTDPMPDRRERKTNNSIVCPNPSCGYLNAVNNTECVRCETPLHEQAETVIGQKPHVSGGEQSKKEELKSVDPRQMNRNAAMNKSGRAPENSGATMNPWSKPKYARFHLLPVSREGEDLNVKLDFEGNTVDLNRGNLEPTNMTITSKVQAIVSYRDGHWYLSNGSEMQTTFIRVDGEIKLEKGDILLMGDRMFEFDC